jgi:type IV pilus assembly protein PilC
MDSSDSTADEPSLRQRLRAWMPVSQPALALWLHQLALMQKSGVDVVRALSLLYQDERHARFRWVLRQILVAVSARGMPLSAACKLYGSVFPAPVVLLMEAGEFGGDLPGCLAKAAAMLDSQYSLKLRIRRVLMPPLMTIVLCLVLLSAAVHVVLPRMLELFEGMHIQPSPAATFLMGMVQWVTGPGLLGLLLGAALFVGLYRDVLGQAVITRLIKTRATSGVMGQILAVSFCDLTGRLYGQGIPLLRIIEMARRNTSQRYHALRLGQVQTDFMAGKPLSEAVLRIEYFPRLVREMILVGEQTGSLEQTLGMVVSVLDQNTEELLTRMTALLEPIALIGTGALVLCFLCGLLLPLYQLMGAVQ